MSIQKTILQKALKLLQIRPYSEGELSKKLNIFFPAEKEDIRKVINELKEAKLLNDVALVEQFVHHWTQKNVGKMRIRMEARKKQLDETLVEHTLNESGWDESESAKKALQVKIRTLNETDPNKRKQKLMRFLQSRGFSQEMIFGVVN